MRIRAVTKNSNLASASFQRCSDKIVHSSFRLESSVYDGSPRNYSFSLKSEALRLCQLQQGDEASDLRLALSHVSACLR